MKMTEKLKRFLSGSLCIMLIAAMAMFTVGCDDSEKESEASASVSESSVDSSSEADEGSAVSVGEGQTSFEFVVVDKDGNQKLFNVNTDKKTVGEALVDAKLVEGEEGDYGLYVKTVDGITLDYDADGYYWAFYINDEYASTSVDLTDIKDGESYKLKAEKA